MLSAGYDHKPWAEMYHQLQRLLTTSFTCIFGTLVPSSLEMPKATASTLNFSIVWI